MSEETKMTLLPPGTLIYEPDGINRVVIQFENQDDAVFFYQFLVQTDMTKGEPK